MNGAIGRIRSRDCAVHGPLRKECHVPSAPMPSRQWVYLPVARISLAAAGGTRRSSSHLLGGTRAWRGHLGEVGPHVDPVVLEVAAKRQHHVAGVEDLAQRCQDLPALAVTRDLLPMRDRVAASKIDAEVGLELVELPGVAQVLDAARADGAQDRLAHVRDRARQRLAAVADLGGGRGRRLLLFWAVGLLLRGLRMDRRDGREPRPKHWTREDCTSRNSQTTRNSCPYAQPHREVPLAAEPVACRRHACGLRLRTQSVPASGASRPGARPQHRSG